MSLQNMKSETASSAREAMGHDSPSSPKTQIIAPSLSFENHKLRNLINKSRHSKQILSLLTEQNSNMKIDAATFGKAMQRCNDLNQYNTTMQIMDIL